MKFRFLFKRKRVSSGQRLLVELRRARNTFIVRRLLKGKSAREMSLADWGTFCKRKSSQLTTDSYNPEKPPGGRFFCCRSIIPVSKRQRSASIAVRRGNSEAPSRHAHLRETAQCLSLSPFHIHIKKRGKISLAFLRTVARPNAAFPQKRGIDESLFFP